MSQNQSSIVLSAVRNAFGEEIRALAGLHGKPNADRVIEAFKRVPREDFVGPGPWQIMSPLGSGLFQTTDTADPEHLYHSVLVALDRNAGINIGEPTLWARLLTRLNVPVGANILQVGSGSGYYSAILADLAGASGFVTGYEINPSIAGIGSFATAKISNLEIRIGNAATDLRPVDGKFDIIVAFAGVTHPSKQWLRTLVPGGRMLLPVTGTMGGGAMCLFMNVGPGRFDCETAGFCRFYPCFGARNKELEPALDLLWGDRTKASGWKFRMTHDEAGVRYEANGKVLSAAFT